jgi:hypothetical protein
VRAVTLTQDDTHLAIDLAAHLSTHKQLKRLQQCLGHHFVFKEMLNEPGHVVNSLGHVNRDIRQVLEQQLEPCFAVVLGDNPTHTQRRDKRRCLVLVRLRLVHGSREQALDQLHGAKFTEKKSTERGTKQAARRRGGRGAREEVGRKRKRRQQDLGRGESQLSRNADSSSDLRVELRQGQVLNEKRGILRAFANKEFIQNKARRCFDAS